MKGSAMALLKAPDQELLIQHARDFLNDYNFRPEFTKLEAEALRPFFTSTDGRVYFIHSLPETVADVLVSMFSRIKNSRGLRGVFTDSFLPLFLGSTLPEVTNIFGGETEKFLKFYGIDSLEKFVKQSPDAYHALERFKISISVDPEYIAEFSSAPKVKKFLAAYMDKYGHNSIARMGKVTLCMENISDLAAKSAEWGRPGIGYIQLSTRYVDMSGKTLYPAWKELSWFGVSREQVQDTMEHSFNYYRALQGENFSGIFPEFLRHYYQEYRGVKGFDNGVVGETCDVLGNFLPCATLTSVGIAMSGEAFPELLKHLLLDATPENHALAELILSEAKKIGGDQFARHYEPTEWKQKTWEYLDSSSFRLYPPISPLYGSRILHAYIPPNEQVKWMLYNGFRKQRTFSDAHNFDDVVRKLKTIPRGKFDKLPNHFEKVAVNFCGIMSLRSWRDLQRQQLSTHYRTYVKPIGFYQYDKPAPREFFDACQKVWQKNYDLYCHMQEHQVPPALMQYALAMGNLVGFEFAANLAQMEFCIWQRSDFSVNHEVRQMFLQMERELRRVYPWWKDVSRANMTPAYVFARTAEGIPFLV